MIRDHWWARERTGKAKAAPPVRAGRWYRPIAFGLTVLAILVAAVVAVTVFVAFVREDDVAIDYRMFVEHGQRWATTGSLYLPYQIDGPFRYDVGSGTGVTSVMPSLYPPLVGPLFWLLGYLPAFVWWAVPIAAMLWAFRGAQPWAWPLVPLAAWFPPVPALFIVGGFSMWIIAGLALGVRLGWPAVVVVFKPTFAPFLLLGIRRRSTWIALGVLAVVSLVMLPEWLRYVTVLRNVQSPGIVYSLNDLPLTAAVLMTAWSGRRSPMP